MNTIAKTAWQLCVPPKAVGIKVKPRLREALKEQFKQANQIDNTDKDLDSH
jgi:hypothetical protein